MRKIIGIISIFLALLAFVVNTGEAYIATLSAVFAIFSFGSGYSYGLSAISLNLVNILFFLSSFWIIPEFMSFKATGAYASTGSILMIMQFIAMVWLVSKQGIYKEKRIKKLQFTF